MEPGQFLVPKKKKKRVRRDTKQPNRIVAFKNALSRLLFLQTTSRVGESLKTYRKRSKHGKRCALPCQRLIREGTYFKLMDKALACLKGRSLVLEGNQPLVKSAYFFT